MASSKTWASIISSIASLLFFLVIILQIPLFRVPCRVGICTTPIKLTSSQLIASEILPAVIVKPLLYPGAIAHALIKNTTIPSYANLLSAYNLNIDHQVPSAIDLQYLEILAGSYFSVVGAIFGVLKPWRMRLFGTLLIIWGFVKEVTQTNSSSKDQCQSLQIYPTMIVTLLSALLSIKSDVRKIVRSFRARRGTKKCHKYLGRNKNEFQGKIN